MANLPDGPLVRINDLEVSADAPITEALLAKMGQDINGLIARTFSFTEYLTSGTFEVPTGITKLWVYACGGGGGGAGGAKLSQNGSSPFVWTGGPGGAGANPTWHLVTVVAGTTYTVTIGAGGSGGASNTGFTSGADGGDTSFGTLAYFRGGEGGKWSVQAAASEFFPLPLAGRGAGSSTCSPGGYGGFFGLSSAQVATAGMPGILGAGGAAGSGTATSTTAPGGGGGGSIGAGGAGGGLGTGGSNGGRGAGGGGGGASSPTNAQGGDGGAGYAMVIYF